MKILFLLLILSFPLIVFNQAKLVLNNDAFLVIDNNAYLVLDNPNSNAIITNGTGGNIISENENNVIKWNIENSTGNYIIPWTTYSNVKIPLSLNITTQGVGQGSLELSTYETDNHLNTPFATGVTNMMHNGLPNELNVVDRFWRIDTTSNYTTNPSIIASFGYSNNELSSPNTITESNLQAQRWNPVIDSWENLTFGVVNTATKQVTNVNIEPSHFFPVWVLVDNITPLPVQMSRFEISCDNIGKKIEWTTESEINNAYFIIEKSYDGSSYFALENVQGNGNSNSSINYFVYDLDRSQNTIYYRLKQVDYDHNETLSQVKSIQCIENNQFDVSQINFINGELNFTINTIEKDDITIHLYDISGKMLLTNKTQIKKGINSFSFSTKPLSPSFYFLSISGRNQVHNFKLINTVD